MDAMLSLVKVDILEWVITRDSRVEPKADLSHHHLTLLRGDEIVERAKLLRKVSCIDHSSSLDREAKRSYLSDQKVHPGKCIDPDTT